jgi:hypothetical protein
MQYEASPRNCHSLASILYIVLISLQKIVEYKQPRVQAAPIAKQRDDTPLIYINNHQVLSRSLLIAFGQRFEATGRSRNAIYI